MMDPELAAASVLLERPDISDALGARALLDDLREPSSSADEETVGLVEWSDRQIRTPYGTDLTVRVYSPVPLGRRHPAVVFFHGGAFILGDLESEHDRCLRYSAEGQCVVVSVDYRLAPEYRFPAGADDCYSALCWAVENAAELGIDANRLAVAGSSAGGALAASTALMARDRGGPAIALQMLLYPVLDDRMVTASMDKFVDTPVWDSANNAAMWAQYMPTGETATLYAAPARADSLAGLPNSYIMTAELDPLRDEAIEYALRLLKEGVSVELHQIAGAYHGFDTRVPDAAISRRAVDDQIHHLRRFLRN